MMVTKRSIPKTDWNLKYSNTGLDFTQMNNGAIAVLAAVSREKGVELAMTFKRSVNVPKFKLFLDELRRKNQFDNMLIVFDNLAVHRNQHVLERMEELSFRWAFTPRYSPSFNGIEEVWAQSKQWLKQERLNAI